METVKSIRRKVPGSAYFKLSNTTIRDRRFRYAHPFCHSRQKGIFALKSFAFHCLRNLQSRSLHLLAGCASAWFCAVIFQLNKATVKRRRMINGLFDLILIIVRMTQQNIPGITALPHLIRYACSHYELNSHYVFALITDTVDYCWCSFANSNESLLASTSFVSLSINTVD